eukprot:310046-Alexandrium_andersonii.AAC.1
MPAPSAGLAKWRKDLLGPLAIQASSPPPLMPPVRWRRQSGAFRRVGWVVTEPAPRDTRRLDR